MAHQAGFDNVVASLGTALTPGQVALLTRYATRIVLAYDVDAGGREGGHARRDRAGRAHRPAPGGRLGVKLEDVRVARLPDGKDPDEVVRESPGALGGGGRQGQAARRVPHRSPRGSVRPQDVGGRIGFVEAVMPAIRDIDDPLRRDEALGEVRRISGVEERTSCARSSSAGSPRPGRAVPATPRDADHRGRGARVARRAADPRHPAGDHAGRGGAAAAAAARARTSSFGSWTSSDRTSCRARSRASCSGRSSSSAPPTTTASTRRSTARRCSWASTTKRAALAQALYAVGPDPRMLEPQLATRSTACSSTRDRTDPRTK